MTSENEILKELQELNSPLATYPRTMPYALPHGYFKDAELQLLTTITNAQPTTGSGMPFAMPAGYFEKLPGQVLNAAKQSSIQEQPEKPVKKNIWLNVRWAAAAMFVITIGFSTYRILNPQPDPTIQQQLDNIPYNDILAYVEYNIDDYETDNLINYLDKNNTISMPAGGINEEVVDYYLQYGEK